MTTQLCMCNDHTIMHVGMCIAVSLGTLVPNSRDRQGKLWLPKKQKTALKTTSQ